MKSLRSSFFLFFVFFCFLFQNCITLSSFQAGRTLGEGNWEMEFSGSGFITNSVRSSLFISPQEEGLQLLLYGELNNYYGVTNNLDIGLRLSTSIYGAFTIKQQLIGGKNSNGALALGGSFGAFNDHYSGWDVRLPVYFSFHSKEAIFYLNPNYIFQFGGQLMGNRRLYGFNMGMVFTGKKVSLAFDSGLYNFHDNEGTVRPMGTIGMSFKLNDMSSRPKIR